MEALVELRAGALNYREYGYNDPMNTKAQLEGDLKQAMRAGDELRKRTLRMALAAIQLAEIEKRAPLDEAAVLSVLQKEIKSQRESIADAERAGRPEMAAQAMAEIGVLESYLPQMLSTAELETLAEQAIAEVGASSTREMGQVMKVLMPRVQGRAEGAQVSQVVRRLLGEFD
jgi:uncharacterized protein YqeY